MLRLVALGKPVLEHLSDSIEKESSDDSVEI